MDLGKVYRTMYLIRRFEETAYELFSNGTIYGSVHTCIGQEAVPVGVSQPLKREDLVISTHRGHGDAIAKGCDPKIAMSELCGRVTGCCKGLGGSMHVADFSVGLVGCNGIVGGSIPIAAGLALAQKQTNTGNVVVVYFGDGAANEGSFHETLNMAAVWQLPVVFVCVNNQYAVTMPFRKAFAVENISKRAEGYGLPGITVDGMDVLAVQEKASEFIERARSGGGPSLLECQTYRFMGHSRGDPPFGPYRSKEEVDNAKKRDPLMVLRMKANLPGKVVEEIEADVEREIREAVEFALQSPKPDPGSIQWPVYA